MSRLASVVGVALLLLALGTGRASADTSSDLLAAQQRAQLIDAVRAQLNGNLADALAAQDQLVKSLQANAEQQAQVQLRVDDANLKIDNLDAQLRALDADIALTNARIDRERRQLRSLARAIYVQPGSVAVMLAESHDLGDLLSRLQALNSAGARANAVKHALDLDAGRLRADRDRQQVARDQQAKLRDAASADMQVLQELRRQQEESKARLQVKISQTRGELSALSGQSADLARQITDLLQRQQDEIIATAMQQVWDQVRVAAEQNPLGAIATSSGHSRQYRFMWPQPDSQLVQGYGPTTLPFEPPYLGFSHFHTGLDTVLPLGAPVLAADDGMVLLVGTGQTGYGNYVVLEHAGGLTTLYGHLSRALVKPGDQVQQGQPIGLEGSTGNSTGPHLHFELRIGGKPVDPAPYLPPGPPSAFRG